MLEQLIKDYGYLALFIGCFLEGETILIIAGVAASEGLLDIRLAILSAFLGTVSGDSVYFLLGRYHGDWLLSKLPRWRPSLRKALKMLERHCVWVILSYRFMYGIRNVTSFAVGVSRIRAWFFALLNLTGAVVWALMFGYGGFYLGEALLRLAKSIRHNQVKLFWLVLAVALAIWLYRVYRRRRRFARLLRTRRHVRSRREKKARKMALAAEAHAARGHAK